MLSQALPCNLLSTPVFCTGPCGSSATLITPSVRRFLVSFCSPAAYRRGPARPSLRLMASTPGQPATPPAADGLCSPLCLRRRVSLSVPILPSGFLAPSGGAPASIRYAALHWSLLGGICQIFLQISLPSIGVSLCVSSRARFIPMYLTTSLPFGF